jgi:uncharacterized membrane protein
MIDCLIKIIMLVVFVGCIAIVYLLTNEVTKALCFGIPLFIIILLCSLNIIDRFSKKTAN